MTFKKTIIIGLMLLISACGGSDEDKALVEVFKEEEKQAFKQQPKEEKELKEQGDEDKIVIGVAWPSDDDNFVKGARLAVKELNHNGGVLNQPLKLLVNEGEKAALDLPLAASVQAKEITHSVANAFVEQSPVVAVIGHRFSNTAISAADIYQSHGLVYLAAMLTNLNLSEQESSYIFRMLPNNEQMGQQIATYCYKAGYQKIIVLSSEDTYGRELTNAFIYYHKKNEGSEIVLEQALPDQDALNELIEKIEKKSDQSHALFIAAEASVASKIYQRLRDKKIMLPLIGGHALNFDSFWKTVKKWEDSVEIIEKSAVPTVFNPLNPPVFIKKFKAEYGESAEPEQLAALGYDSVKLLAHGMIKARSSVPAKFAETLHTMSTCQGAIGPYRFRSNGNLVNRKFYFKSFRQEQFKYKEVVRTKGIVLVPDQCGEVDRDKDNIFNEVDVCPDNSQEEISKGVYQQGELIGCPVDSDKDGYHDYRDSCPNTLEHEFKKGIDARGCPRDTDNDGVPDYKDLCSANLQKSTLVDEKGCAPDADQDHVYDDKDICPNNKPEELSQGIYLYGEKAGCPIDSDNDTVPDYRDQCFMNIPLEIKKGIDSHGCPIDTDKDEIPDYEDVCFDNTPEEISSGIYLKGKKIGCPIDSDQDTIPDYRDKCIKNAVQQIKKGVDSQGCPIDTDKDGVLDYDDACPSNSLLEIKKGVDSRGCPVDSDRDRIPDYNDVCIENSAKEIAKGVYQQGSFLGCPIDTDQDSVPDYRDKCPKNNAKEIGKGINSRGCPVDSDKDRIPDYKDVCPNNTSREIAKGVFKQGTHLGCPKDRDQDAVPDYRDQCPRNSRKELKNGVDLRTGCPLDSDKDGIPDYKDVCVDNSQLELSKGIIQKGLHLGCPKDKDNDGVPDYRDQCPKNRQNEIIQGVDPQGCPPDSDQDGIPDYKDACIHNSLAEIAKGVYQKKGELGCPIDSDEDGVPDYRDDCPSNTPLEISKNVDLQGCPFDTDQDNVPDYKDACFHNTPEALSKGIYQLGIRLGCPIDTDEDGVPDYRDVCIKNNRLEISKGVDSQGCPIDTDKDHIPDYKDLCFNNRLEELSKGISQQKERLGCPIDTDKDSVSDYRDDCPKNSALQISKGVNSQGCPVDIDQDNIPDYRDDCPNNQSYQLKKGIDLRGCPIDTDKDTVPDYQDQCAGTPLEVAVDRKGCTIVVREKISQPGKMSFSSKNQNLTEETQAFLKTLLKQTQNRFFLKLEIIGHTDTIGTDAANMALSIARAKRVAEYVISQGFPRDKILIKGAGETQPIASNKTAEGREKNRRVDIIITQFKKR
jgi:ABC-type branched-subunit amino acid transport system substrate-binding protein/outer membrane protein OmpA-like peptidoglycan-associated protein